MRWFRRRAGRHAAGQPAGAAVSQPVPAPWAAASAPTRPTPPAERIQPPQPRQRVAPTGPLPADGRVRLGFSDGSAVTLAPDDPRARAFRALARELARRG